jgi:tetratricopeptide (TPR) repeat protein
MRWLGWGADWALGLGIAASLALVAFLTTGGTELGPNTWVEIALSILGAVVAATVVVVGAPGRAWGGLTLALFAALAALTFGSIAWSVQPAQSWVEADRTLSYLAAFGAGIALARLTPGRWRALAGAIAVYATVIGAYALLVKVFPETFDPSGAVARLRAPFDYWNATGLVAAMGLPACLWAGARDARSSALRALTVPAIGILIATLVLASSRGALIAGLVGVGCWLAFVPLRLRAVSLLALGTAGGGAVSLWASAHKALTTDLEPLPSRTAAGHTFGVVLLVAVLLLTLAGFIAAVAIDRVSLPAQARRRIGTALVVLVGLVPVGGVVALASSSRGLTGEVSHIWSTLTSASGGVGNTPGRLVALSNSRPRYWGEGLKVGEHALFKGVGALGYATARTRYANDRFAAGHAHSYVIETFADFGLIGTALSLALLIAWAGATGRTLGVRSLRGLGDWRRGDAGRTTGASDEHPEERAGLMTLLATVLIFGVHSSIDWTWFIPGAAVPALVCAGWLAGRGPLAGAVGRAERPRDLTRTPGAAAVVLAIAAAAIFAAWVIWQPLRSADADASAIAAVSRGDPRAALVDARTAVAEDPVDAVALWDLSAVYASVGDRADARRELVKAASLQPANSRTWLELGTFDVGQHHPRDALLELGRALALDPTSAPIQQEIAAARGELR